MSVEWLGIGLNEMVLQVHNPRPEGCPGFRVQRLKDRIPIDGIHYDSSSRTVPNWICQHRDKECVLEAEYLYFFYMCVARGILKKSDWKLFFPRKGDKGKCIPCFSKEEKSGCVGFQVLEYSGDGDTMLKAGVSWHEKLKIPFSAPCFHKRGCSTFSPYYYAMVMLYARGFDLKVKDDIDFFWFFKNQGWAATLDRYERAGVEWARVFGDLTCYPHDLKGEASEFVWLPSKLSITKDCAAALLNDVLKDIACFEGFGEGIDILTLFTEEPGQIETELATVKTATPEELEVSREPKTEENTSRKRGRSPGVVAASEDCTASTSKRICMAPPAKKAPRKRMAAPEDGTASTSKRICMAPPSKKAPRKRTAAPEGCTASTSKRICMAPPSGQAPRKPVKMVSKAPRKEYIGRTDKRGGSGIVVGIHSNSKKWLYLQRKSKSKGSLYVDFSAKDVMDIMQQVTKNALKVGVSRELLKKTLGECIQIVRE